MPSSAAVRVMLPLFLASVLWMISFSSASLRSPGPARSSSSPGPSSPTTYTCWSTPRRCRWRAYGRRPHALRLIVRHRGPNPVSRLCGRRRRPQPPRGFDGRRGSDQRGMDLGAEAPTRARGRSIRRAGARAARLSGSVAASGRRHAGIYWATPDRDAGPVNRGGLPGSAGDARGDPWHGAPARGLPGARRARLSVD